MHSLRWKLALAFLLVIFVSVSLTTLLTVVRSGHLFDDYVLQAKDTYVQQVVETLDRHYASEGSWAGIQSVLSDMPLFDNNRLALADVSGVIVGDTNAEWLGKSAADMDLTNPVSVAISGNEVGRLYVLPSGEQGEGARHPDQGRIYDLLGVLWVAAVAVIAILLGFLVTRQLTKPIQDLKKGASRIASRDLTYRVTAKSNDEFGDLANSFNSMAASLESSEEARRHLFTDIAHELRTPLSVIEGTVDAMLDGVYETSPENLASIKEETARLTALVGDVRDLALAEAGQLKLEIEPTDLAKLVHTRVSQAEVMALDKGIRLRTDIAEDLPMIEIDARRIEQAIANLIENALNHTPPGGTIIVTVAAGGEKGFPGDKDQILVSVADTGEGIPAEHLQHIFERFYRVDEARSRKAGGAGLGLAIARQMVELNGGRIWVESQVGKGSRFSFVLPLSRPESSA